MDNLKSINDLIFYVNTILGLKRKATPKHNNFTVFSALRNETDEDKTHTTFLYEILRTDGMHGMGDVFLKSFFETVLNLPYSPTARIYQEYHIHSDDNYGRSDLCIETASDRYPIEIKIYAHDQDCQIDRYVKFARKKSKTSKVYYLTLDGHSPSSCSKSNEDDFVCISFAEDIHKWLTTCIEIASHDKNIVDVLNQYRTLLNKLTNVKEDDIYMNAVEKIICSSKENYECAMALEQGLLAVRLNTKKTIFEKIKEHLSACINCDYNISDIKKSTCSLTYEIKSAEKITLQLVFEISVDTFYYGVRIITKDNKKLPDNFIKKYKKFIMCLYDNNDWQDWVNKIPEEPKQKNWVWWRWLPSKEEQIDFSKCAGENYIKLYDATEFNKIMNKIYLDIDSNLDFILKNGVPKDKINTDHY